MDGSELHPLAQAAIDAHEAIAPKVADAKKAHIVDLLETFEQDIAPMLAPFVQQALDDPATPDHVKAILAPLAGPEHFGESIILGIALGSIISPVLTAIFDPVVVELAKHQWELAVGGPSIVPLGGRPVSPDLLAAAALKGVVTESDGASQAAQSGISADSFHTMFETAGQSIGLAEALLLLRRNQITIDTFTEIIRYSNINAKFYGLPELLQYGPVSVGEAITGALKHRLDPATARTYVAHAGIDPANFDWLLASAGRPPGTEQILDLWNKSQAGLIATSVSEADVAQAVEQSDINDEFLPFILELRHYFPPPRSIVPMIRAGAITDAQAGQLLDGYGVGEPWKSAFIAEGHTTKTGAAKELTQAQVIRLYEAQLISRADATARLEALRIPAGDVTLLLDFADNSRVEALTNATIRAVGAKYVAHKITLADASHLLSTAGVANAAQNQLVALWDIERTANVHVPSPAAIVGAGRRQEITPAEVKTRLNQAGITDADLAIFVADGWPPGQALAGQAAAHAVVNNLAAWPGAAGGPAPAPKRLTVVQISQAYTAGTVGKAEALADLELLGYSSVQANELVGTFTPHVPPVP